MIRRYEQSVNKLVMCWKAAWSYFPISDWEVMYIPEEIRYRVYLSIHGVPDEFVILEIDFPERLVEEEFFDEFLEVTIKEGAGTIKDLMDKWEVRL